MDIFNEELVHKYGEFVAYIHERKTAMLQYATRRAKCLFDLSSGTQTVYQQGKMIEEIGEFIQAVGTRNWRLGKPYPEARGTIESEAADVVIATCAYAALTNRATSCRPSYIHSTEVMLSDLLRAAHEDDPAKVISVIYEFILKSGADMVKEVDERIRYNEGTSI